MIRLIVFLLACTSPAAAGSVVPVAPIRAGTVIDASHLALSDELHPGSLTDMRDAIGLEARINLYPNRPLRPEHLGAPTLIERNAPVEMIYRSGGLRISVTGRALSRAGAGETVRVMNMSSRATLVGIAVGPNQVEVTQ